MTRLWIDGIEAVLPETFSISVKRENPFFTKNGEYTYDITLSLLNNINADLYKHLNRLNSVTDIKSKRRALLMADNRVYCDGTEVITGWTEKQVTIQVAGGNSELNYLIGGSLRIEWLTLMDDETRWQIIESVSNKEKFITALYPEVNFNFASYGIPDSSIVGNIWHFNASDGSIRSFTGMMEPQPYLCAVIRMVAKAVGYTMVENQIEQTPYKNLFIVNGRRDNPDWGQLFKGWSVEEFFEEIEKMFNGVFVVNNRTREISFVFKNNYYTGSAISHVRHVVDSYEAEQLEEAEVEDMKTSNVGYEGESDWWKWQRLDENITKGARRETIPADYPDGVYIRPYNFFLDEAHHRKDTIYTDELNGREYIWVGEPLEQHDVSWGWDHQPIVRYRRVEALKDVVRDEESEKITLGLHPAETVWAETFYNNPLKYFYLAVPKCTDYVNPYVYEEESVLDGLDIAASITGEQSTQSGESSDKATIALAFYDGLKKVDIINGVEIKLPLPYIIDTIELPNYIVLAYRDSNSEGASLAPAQLDAYFYQGGYEIDYKKEIKIKSYDPNVFDPSTVWEVRNKRYVCKEVEYTLNARGRLGAWTATLYPIRISDTEAGVKWILTDGKWRDGGIWIDNGRWLDN